MEREVGKGRLQLRCKINKKFKKLEEYDYNCNYIYISMLIKVTDEKILIYINNKLYLYVSEYIES